MRQTIFLFSTLVAIILATTITIWYIDKHCGETCEITASKSAVDSIKITNNK